MAYRRADLLAIGGFDPQFRVAGDDVDVCWRLQEQGLTLGFHPAAVVWHRRRSSIGALLAPAARLRQGRGAARAQVAGEATTAAATSTWAGRLYDRASASACARRRASTTARGAPALSSRRSQGRASSPSWRGRRSGTWDRACSLLLTLLGCDVARAGHLRLAAGRRRRRVRCVRRDRRLASQPRPPRPRHARSGAANAGRLPAPGAAGGAAGRAAVAGPGALAAEPPLWTGAAATRATSPAGSSTGSPPGSESGGSRRPRVTAALASSAAGPTTAGTSRSRAAPPAARACLWRWRSTAAADSCCAAESGQSCRRWWCALRSASGCCRSARTEHAQRIAALAVAGMLVALLGVRRMGVRDGDGRSAGRAR